MLNPKKYRIYIKELAIDDLELDVSTSSNCIETLNAIEEIIDILNKLKYNVRMDLRNIRKNYLMLMKEVENSPSKKGRFRGWKSSSKLTQKKDLKKKRDLKIASYEEIEELIDDYLCILEDAKDYVKNSIET
jgi:translation initiation factor IF-2